MSIKDPYPTGFVLDEAGNPHAPTEDTPTPQGASEKHQCICKDCGKQVVDPVVAQTIMLGSKKKAYTDIRERIKNGATLPAILRHCERSYNTLRRMLKQLEEGTDLIATDSSQDTVTPSRPGEHKKQELERGE